MLEFNTVMIVIGSMFKRTHFTPIYIIVIVEDATRLFCTISKSYIVFSLMLSWIEDCSLSCTSPRNYIIYW